MSRLRVRSERGFFTIWVLGMCLFLFAIGGVSLDLWKGFSERRTLSQIADSAAIAGASKVDLGAFQTDSANPKLEQAGTATDPETAVARANAYIDEAIADNSLTLTNRDVVVTNDNHIEVTLTEKVNNTLTKLFAGDHNYVVTVHGAAEPRVAN